MDDTWTPWVWAVFAFTCLFNTIFAFLCWDTFTEFRRVEKLGLQATEKGWSSLFAGAAGSAFFAVILVVIFVACSIYYMVLTRKGLSHPASRYGKGFMVALTFMCGLHICNIATHFLSFSPAMTNFTDTYKVEFNRLLLTSTYVFGYLTCAWFLVLSLMLELWRRKDVEILYQQTPPHSPAV
jgi:hypothetical protein